MSPITNDELSEVSPISESDLPESVIIFTPSIQLTKNHPESLPSATSYTFKIIGDNLDKTVRPRYMRRLTGLRTQSLHLFHSCAVLDRLDTSALCDVLPQGCIPSPDSLALSLLPTTEDDDAIKSNFSILISRILIENCHFFEVAFKDIVVYHIPHEHDKEMCVKSEVVCCKCCKLFSLIFFCEINLCM